MGLDIHVVTDNSEELRLIRFKNEDEGIFNKHSLSRTFCDFMCRRHVAEHESEPEQISRITGVDFSALYEMESSPTEENLSFDLEFAESDEERAAIIQKANQAAAQITGNIDRVLLLLQDLIQKLNSIENLPALLIQTDWDTLGNAEYFSDFLLDKGEGYIGNNFGQDLRNFQRFLEFAKQNGTSTVWFNYG